MSQWINVKDRLPLYKECILVLYDNKNKYPFIVDAIYRGQYTNDLHTFRIPLLNEDIECKIGEFITHWMKLPKTP